MKPFVLMITFLTRIPIKINFEINEVDFKSGIWYMPVVGLIIGIILYAVYYFLHDVISPLILAFILLAVYFMITGGLHIDGLADTFDAIGSNRSKERMLEIMKDSHIGTFGVLSITVYCIGMVIILAEIPSMCLIFPVLGRSMALFSCSISSYARQDGLGKTIIENTKLHHVLFSFFILLISISIVALLQYNLLVIYTVLVPCIITLMIIWFSTKNISKKIDGITGDVIGYVIEMSGLIFLLVSYFIHVLLRCI